MALVMSSTFIVLNTPVVTCVLRSAILMALVMFTALVMGLATVVVFALVHLWFAVPVPSVVFAAFIMCTALIVPIALVNPFADVPASFAAIAAPFPAVAPSAVGVGHH